MSPDHVDIIFDPHIAVALLLLFVAIVVVFAVALIPIEDDPVRRRQNRKE